MASKAHICENELIFSLRRDLRFIEVVENVCQRLLEYNLHKERAGSNRFAKVRLLCLVCQSGILNVKVG